MKAKLKAPFPYFGGKSSVASLVWDRLGDVDNFIEPFCGSAAVLLARPTPPRIETVNDKDSMVANFWRATSKNPEAVAEYADWPVNEADLHARHRHLVLSEAATDFRERMRKDPDYYDAKFAGWWCWGLCCWIGSGWCQSPETCEREGRATAVGCPKGLNTGIRGQDNRKPRIDGGEGQYGHGVHVKGQSERIPAGQRGPTGVHAKRPRVEREGATALPGVHGAVDEAALSQQVPLIGDPPRGVHRAADLGEQVPRDRGRGIATPAVTEISDTNRPQLADAYSRGRGVNGNDSAGTCAQRRAWLLDWFGWLRDRLRTVRVCCGHWLRVCDSESVTTRLGMTGLMLDPPYPTHKADGTQSRDGTIYTTDSGRDDLDKLRDEVLAYCLERGSNPKMRIAVCGYDTDGYAVLEKEGWEVVAWRAQGGYGNRKGENKNAGRERIWFSPACVKPSTLFDGLED